jgi:hypothetical protein
VCTASRCAGEPRRSRARVDRHTLSAHQRGPTTGRVADGRGAGDGASHSSSAWRRRTTAVIALVFAILAAALIILGIGFAAPSDATVKLGGWFGLASAVPAWYASFAAVTNSTFGRNRVPIWPLVRR